MQSWAFPRCSISFHSNTSTNGGSALRANLPPFLTALAGHVCTQIQASFHPPLLPARLPPPRSTTYRLPSSTLSLCSSPCLASCSRFAVCGTHLSSYAADIRLTLRVSPPIPGQRFYQTALALSAGVCAGGATWYQLDATLVASGSLSPMAGVGVAAGVGIVALAAVAACSLLGFVFASASAGSTTVAIALHVASPSPPEPVILTAVAGLLAAALALLVRACSRQDGEEPSSLLGCCRLSKSRGDRRRPALPRRPSPLHTLRAERCVSPRLVPQADSPASSRRARLA